MCFLRISCGPLRFKIFTIFEKYFLTYMYEGVDRGGGGTGVDGAESGVEGAESGVEGVGSGGRGGGEPGKIGAGN